MGAELPYLPSYKNVGLLFEKIAAAKQPPAFTTRFLGETLGIKGTADRTLIPLLRTLGFLDANNKPTATYSLLKNPVAARKAVAEGIRKAYEPLFTANENAHSLDSTQLRGLIAQVAGSDEGMTQKICGTLNALIKHSDFSGGPASAQGEDQTGNGGSEDEEQPDDQTVKSKLRKLRPEFHYNIQIHLPANATQETYLNIFNALRQVFTE